MVVSTVVTRNDKIIQNGFKANGGTAPVIKSRHHNTKSLNSNKLKDLIANMPQFDNEYIGGPKYAAGRAKPIVNNIIKNREMNAIVAQTAKIINWKECTSKDANKCYVT